MSEILSTSSDGLGFLFLLRVVGRFMFTYTSVNARVGKNPFNSLRGSKLGRANETRGESI